MLYSLATIGVLALLAISQDAVYPHVFTVSARRLLQETCTGISLNGTCYTCQDSTATIDVSIDGTCQCSSGLCEADTDSPSLGGTPDIDTPDSPGDDLDGGLVDDDDDNEDDDDDDDAFSSRDDDDDDDRDEDEDDDRDDDDDDDDRDEDEDDDRDEDTDDDRDEEREDEEDEEDSDDDE